MLAWKSKLTGSVLWHKLVKWEYWPFYVLYFPISFYYIYLALRARSLFFFAASNPKIDFGGMLGESKAAIFDLIPDKYIPRTKRFSADVSLSHVTNFLNEHNLDFPIICKPDIGERGWMVEKIRNTDELIIYLNRIKVDFLAQEYVNYPVELGVFYYRMPGNEKGNVSSIVVKDMLHVIGNGNKTTRELIQANPRANMQLEMLERDGKIDLDAVPEKNIRVELEPIGNHCKGTTFLNGNMHISANLEIVFDTISKEIEEFYFGRFDLRCKSIADLEKGAHFKILELNGAGAEPGHIYQPGYALLKGYTDICFHLNKLCTISIVNHRRGFKHPTFVEGIKKIAEIRRYNKSKN